MSCSINILITNEAKSDIAQIIDYIHNDNPKAAIRLLEVFEKTFEMLAIYPKTGITKNGIKNTSVFVYSIKKRYAIIYRIKENNLEILRILTRYQDIFAVL